MTMMVLAIRLYDVGLRDDAVFWFYVAKDRYIVLSDVLNVKTPQLAQADDAVRNFATLAGPVINGYAFCDLARQKAAHAKAVEWVEANPYEVMFRPDVPALPGDRAANAKRAIANAKERAAKESAYFDDPKDARGLLRDAQAERSRRQILLEIADLTSGRARPFGLGVRGADKILPAHRKPPQIFLERTKRRQLLREKQAIT